MDGEAPGDEKTMFLAFPNRLRTRERKDVTSIVADVQIRPVRAIISDRRKPVLPANKTIARSRIESCSGKTLELFRVMTSLSR